MTNKERFTTVQKNIETIKVNKYTVKKDEAELLKSITEKSKKDELEKALTVADEVIKRNLERIAKQTAEAKKEADKQKAVASLKKPTEKKKEAEKKAPKKKAEPKKEEINRYPQKYETATMILEKVEWTDESLELLKNQQLLIGRYLDIKVLSDSQMYSFKEKEIHDALMKMKDNSPFIENIDLYKAVTENQFLTIMQSLVTESFNSMRKDVLEASVKKDAIALYKYTMKEEKKEEPKKAPRKKATAKKAQQ